MVALKTAAAKAKEKAELKAQLAAIEAKPKSKQRKRPVRTQLTRYIWYTGEYY